MKTWNITSDGEKYSVQVPSTFEELRNRVETPEDLFIMARQHWVEKLRHAIRSYRRDHSREEAEAMTRDYIYTSRDRREAS